MKLSIIDNANVFIARKILTLLHHNIPILHPCIPMSHPHIPILQSLNTCAFVLIPLYNTAPPALFSCDIWHGSCTAYLLNVHLTFHCEPFSNEINIINNNETYIAHISHVSMHFAYTYENEIWHQFIYEGTWGSPYWSIVELSSPPPQPWTLNVWH